MQTTNNILKLVYKRGYFDISPIKASARLVTTITANYYICTDEILAGLGKMYVAEARFKKNIDKYGEGTAEFASEGIRIYVEKK